METLTPPNDLTMLRTWMAKNLEVPEKPINIGRVNVSYMLIPTIMNTDVPSYFNAAETIVCAAFGIPVDRLSERTRKRQVTESRQLIWFLMKDKFGERVSLEFIAKRYKKDHATALHGIRQTQNKIQTERDFRATYQQIKIKLAI